MNIEKNDNVGSLVISDEVVAKIASVAAADVDGVAGLAPVPVSLKNVVSGSKSVGGVRVSLTQDKAMIIDLHVILKPDAKLKDTAADIQHNVKYAVMNMTGKPVAKVNVTVENIEINNSGEE